MPPAEETLASAPMASLLLALSLSAAAGPQAGADAGHDASWPLRAALALVELEDEPGPALLECALAIRSLESGPGAPDPLDAHHRAGFLLASAGRYDRALPRFERALELARARHGGASQRSAEALNAVAAMRQRLGDVAGARRDYGAAIEIYAGLGEEAAEPLSMLLHNVGALLLDHGDVAAAREHFERALAIREALLGPDAPRTGSTLLDLAHACLLMGDEHLALAYAQRALTIRAGSLGMVDSRTVDCLGRLAQLFQHHGRLAEARTLLESVLQARERDAGPGHPHTALAQTQLASIAFEQGDRALARELLERALATFDGLYPAEHSAPVTTRLELALVMLDLGDAERAWELARGRGDQRAAQRAEILAALTETESYLYLERIRWQLDVALAAAERLDDPRARTEAYEGVLRWKGQVTRAVLAQRALFHAEPGGRAARAVERLRAAQAEIASLVFRDVAGEPLDDALLTSLREERNAAEVALLRELGGWDAPGGSAASAAPDVARPPEAEVRFDAFRTQLPAGAVAIDFLIHRGWSPSREAGGRWIPGGLGEPLMAAWVTRPELAEPRRVALGDAASLEALARGFVDVVRRGLDWDAPELRARLWMPLAEHVEPARSLVVSTDGFLGTLPFEALPLGDGTRLVERASVEYTADLVAYGAARAVAEVPDALALLVAQDAQDAQDADDADDVGVGVGAGPAEANGDPRSAWSALPATGDEGRAVLNAHAAAFGARGSRLHLASGAANEARLKAELGRARVVHLATHGFYRDERGAVFARAAIAVEPGATPARIRAERGTRDLLGALPGLRAGLVCAGAEPAANQPEDGYLTAEEIAWLDLGGTELVVLAACESGLGALRLGEDAISLRRAFHVAGARHVVSSLWPVEDRATARLMERFYAHLWGAGLEPGAALRAAKLELKELGEPPASWCAFVLSTR